MSTDTGGPAFPSGYEVPEYHGMTLRDYFAAKAMHAIRMTTPPTCPYETIVKYAYQLADAMLKERNA